MLPLWLVIAVAVAAVVAFVLLSFLRQRKSFNTVLVAGPPGGGKTCLFAQLRDGHFPETHTSLKSQEGQFKFHGETSGNPVHTVCYPGHPRLRAGMKDFLPITRCIVFVVDSVELINEARQYADFLYDLLTDKHVQTGNIPILVACNKQDSVATPALSPAQVKKYLEKELDHLKKSKSSLHEQGTSNESTVGLLGMEGEPFDFTQAPCEIVFQSCSVKDKHINDLTAWIRTLIP